MRWSEAGYLSRIMLAHAPRQVSVSLILSVRQNMKRPLRTFAVTLLLTHLALLFFGLDSETGASTQLFLGLAMAALICSIALFVADLASRKPKDR
jgi:hypothetical protein